MSDSKKKDDPDEVETTAAKAEAEGAESLTVEYDGEDWEIPLNRGDWDIEAQVAIEEGKFFVLLKMLLGPAQWRRFTVGKRRTFADGDAFVAKILAESMGAASQGE